jgi:hypothetical protein
MGRVRRYKKLKSVDPFNRKGSGNASSGKFNEPPNIFEDGIKRKNKKLRKQFDDPDENERQLQKEAIRDMKLKTGVKGLGTMGNTSMKGLREAALQKQQSSLSKKDRADKKDEGFFDSKRENETMKEFKTRIRQQTKEVLRNELRSNTKTAKKNKEYFKEKLYKKRGYRPIDVNEEEFTEGFSSRSDGVLRYSDLGGKDDFDGKEERKFGERVDDVPEFKHLKSLKVKSASPSAPEGVYKAAPGKDMSDRNTDLLLAKELENDKKVIKVKKSETVQKKKKDKRKISDIVTSNSADDSRLSKYDKMSPDAVLFGASRRQGVGGAKASKAEMEELRAKVQKAYKEMKDKKRKT